MPTDFSDRQNFFNRVVHRTVPVTAEAEERCYGPMGGLWGHVGAVAMRSDIAEKSETVVSFAPAARGRTSNETDPLENAGQAIIGMLERAANISKENCQHAVDVAHKLSLQLRAAEDQIKELSTDLRYYQDRAHRAEQWLLRISKEIDEKFLESAPSHPRHNAL